VALEGTMYVSDTIQNGVT